MVLGIQFQNAALARYPEAVTELAVFALGYATFGFFRASLNFIAQLTTVFARSAFATTRCHRFVLVASLVIMTPLLFLGHSESGSVLFSQLYRIDAGLTTRVREYLIYLAPIIILGGQRFFYTGLLVQARLTGWVTILNLIFLSIEIAGLVTNLAFLSRLVADPDFTAGTVDTGLIERRGEALTADPGVPREAL
ncbi:MAG: hypothetical protein ACE5D6_03490, partial [Candidatus Zixiibacteriota bacterium]